MKNKKKESFLKENYKKSWKYLKESKVFIYSSIIVFVLFILLGAAIPAPEIVEEKIFEFMKELIIKTKDMTKEELIFFIFLNNVQSSFFGMILGILFGIFSGITLAINGYLIGFVSIKSIEIGGWGVLWKLVPHGVFELPALFISLGLGLKLGSFILEKNKGVRLKEYIIESLRVFVFVVIPLLIIAAIIEGTLIAVTRV